jgi:hypothetical protein
VVVGPVRHLSTMSTRALFVTGTSGKLLPFSAVHADLALCLEQTVFQAHACPPIQFPPIS